MAINSDYRHLMKKSTEEQKKEDFKRQINQIKSIQTRGRPSQRRSALSNREQDSETLEFLRTEEESSTDGSH